MRNEFPDMGYHCVHLVAMKFKIYISVEGPGFDPGVLNSKLAHSLKGNIRERKNLSEKSRNQRIYWESKELVVTSGFPEDALLDLLSNYESAFLLVLAESGDIKISAQIVEKRAEGESPRGFFVSSSLIEILARLRADLDMDIIDFDDEGAVSRANDTVR